MTGWREIQDDEYLLDKAVESYNRTRKKISILKTMIKPANEVGMMLPQTIRRNLRLQQKTKAMKKRHIKDLYFNGHRVRPKLTLEVLKQYLYDIFLTKGNNRIIVTQYTPVEQATR